MVHTTHFTTGEVARRLGISHSTHLRAVRRGEIQPAFRTPGGAQRFDLADLNAYAYQLASGSPRPSTAPARQPEPVASTGSPAAADRGVVVFALDPAGTITVSVGAAQALLGVSPLAAIGQSVFELYRDDPHSLDQVRRALAGEVVTFASQARGTAIEHLVVPQCDSAGTVTRLLGMATDVIALMAAEEALGRSEARAKALLESAPDVIIVIDRDGCCPAAHLRHPRCRSAMRAAVPAWSW
jgi:excisionase family DNA binding protein